MLTSDWQCFCSVVHTLKWYYIWYFSSPTLVVLALTYRRCSNIFAANSWHLQSACLRMATASLFQPWLGSRVDVATQPADDHHLDLVVVLLRCHVCNRQLSVDWIRQLPWRRIRSVYPVCCEVLWICPPHASGHYNILNYQWSLVVIMSQD
jgi:hypothetical protein